MKIHLAVLQVGTVAGPLRLPPHTHTDTPVPSEGKKLCVLLPIVHPILAIFTPLGDTRARVQLKQLLHTTGFYKLCLTDITLLQMTHARPWQVMWLSLDSQSATYCQNWALSWPSRALSFGSHWKTKSNLVLPVQQVWASWKPQRQTSVLLS